MALFVGALGVLTPVMTQPTYVAEVMRGSTGHAAKGADARATLVRERHRWISGVAPVHTGGLCCLPAEQGTGRLQGAV